MVELEDLPEPLREEAEYVTKHFVGEDETDE